MQTIIKNGNRAVIINENGNSFYANLYVNVRNADILDWDITTIRNTFKSLAGAEKWAGKQVSA